jgi:hypothetical protein
MLVVSCRSDRYTPSSAGPTWSAITGLQRVLFLDSSHSMGGKGRRGSSSR